MSLLWSVICYRHVPIVVITPVTVMSFLWLRQLSLDSHTLVLGNCHLADTPVLNNWHLAVTHTPVLDNCHLAVTHMYLTIFTWQSHTCTWQLSPGSHTHVLDNCHLAVTHLYFIIVTWQSHACPWQLSLGNHTPVLDILHLSLAVGIWQSSQLSLTVSKPVLDTHYICPWYLATWQSSQLSLLVSKPVLDTHYIDPWQLPLGNDQHTCPWELSLDTHFTCPWQLPLGSKRICQW